MVIKWLSTHTSQPFLETPELKEQKVKREQVTFHKGKAGFEAVA